MSSREANPFRFLTPLDGSEPTDQTLIALTREEELRVITGMVAASKVSILYAFSGNGKTSLINAGVIPFFAGRGYAVFRTRPRPPWSHGNPAQAFRESVVRDNRLPAMKPAVGLEDLEVVERFRHRLDSDAMDVREMREMLDRLERTVSQVADFPAKPPDLEEVVKGAMQERLPVFVSRVRDALGPDVRMVFVCDQFEELFVHYGNTPEMDDFVAQLGELWADDSLKVHLLFSMREEWVGSMIEFRRRIPSIFSNYFKLNPLRQSRAKQIVSASLARVDCEPEAAMVDCLMDDLAKSYSLNERDQFSDVKLTRSPKEDPFIELPALQVVATKLWETRQEHAAPFTLEHYHALPRISGFPIASDGPNNGGDPDERDHAAQIVLDTYLVDHLDAIEDPEKYTPKTWKDLRIDCLYLLTDGTRHRRALTEDVLLRELKRQRPTEIETADLDEVLVDTAMKPFVERRFVRQEQTSEGKRQYELAHDFAVRAVIRNWRRLDRERAGALAVRKQEQQQKDEQLTGLVAQQRGALRFLQIAPLAVGIALAFSIVVLLTYNRESLGNSIEMIKWGVVLPAVAIAAVAIANRYTWGIVFGALSLVFGLVYALMLDHVMEQSMASQYGYLRHEEEPLLALSVFAPLFFLTYLPLLRSTSRQLEGSARVQRITGILWAELIDVVAYTAVGVVVGMLVAFLSGGDDELAIGYGVSAGVIAALASAWWLSRRGVTAGYHSAGYVLRRATDGTAVSGPRALWRQLLFLVWVTSNIYLAIPWLVLGPLFIGFSKQHRNVYDILAGTVPTDKEGTVLLPSTLVAPGAWKRFSAAWPAVAMSGALAGLGLWLVRLSQMWRDSEASWHITGVVQAYAYDWSFFIGLAAVLVLDMLFAVGVLTGLESWRARSTDPGLSFGFERRLAAGVGWVGVGALGALLGVGLASVPLEVGFTAFWSSSLLHVSLASAALIAMAVFPRKMFASVAKGELGRVSQAVAGGVLAAIIWAVVIPPRSNVIVLALFGAIWGLAVGLRVVAPPAGGAAREKSESGFAAEGEVMAKVE